MLGDIPQDLHRFFVPQLEQVGSALARTDEGLYAHIGRSASQGWLWAMPLSSWCLATSHEIVARKAFILSERPGTFACLCSSAPQCIDGTPLERPAHLRRAENLYSFGSYEAECDFELQAETPYRSHCLCLTARLPKERPDLWPGSFDSLMEALSLIEPNTHNPELRFLLKTLSDPTFLGASSKRRRAEQAGRALRLLMHDAAEALAAHRASGSTRHRGIARQAQKLIDANLDEPFSIDDLARTLHTGRTTLCMAFKEETGQSIGAYQMNRRVDAAKTFLCETRMPLSQVAERVGYRCQGSFTDAFKAATGVTPSCWREKNR